MDKGRAEERAPSLIETYDEAAQPKFDLRSRIKQPPLAENLEHQAAPTPAPVEQSPVQSSKDKSLQDRLGKRQKAGSAAVVPKNGRQYTGLVQGVENHKINCWVIPDGQPAGTRHYLLYEDLPMHFEIMDGTRVDYNLVPSKKGLKKCSHIYVHQPKRAQVEPPALVTENNGTASEPAGPAAAPAKAAPSKKAPPAKRKLALSTDPEEEARRKRRADRFGMDYKPLSE